MPRQRQQDLYPDEIGQTPSDLASKFASFVKEARQLQEQTSGIRLLVGCETEWITADEFAGSIKALVDEYALDFVVGSVHHVHEIPIDYSRELFDKALAMHAGDFNGLFAAFYDAQFEMLQAVKPAVVGHVDLIKMYVPSQPYSEDVLGRIDRNVAFAVSYGALFELNSRAFKKGIPSPYPMPDVLSVLFGASYFFALLNPFCSELWHRAADSRCRTTATGQTMSECTTTNLPRSSRRKTWPTASTTSGEQKTAPWRPCTSPIFSTIRSFSSVT